MERDTTQRSKGIANEQPNTTSNRIGEPAAELEHNATVQDEGRREALKRFGAAGVGVSLWPIDWWSPGNDEEQLDFLFYNTWLLDGFDLPEIDFGWFGSVDLGNIGDKPQLNQRATEIGQELDEAEYDIVAMCENFRHEQRTRIESEVSSLTDSFFGPGSTPVGEFDIPSKTSGLHTFTTGETEMVDTDATGYSARGDYIRDADYYANKGAQYVEIDAGPGNIDLFTTHMIAGGGTGIDPNDIPFVSADSPESYQTAQLKEFREFIEAKQKPENITVVGGDFNINAASPSSYNGESLHERLVSNMDSLGLYDVWDRHGGEIGTTFIKGGPPGGLDRGKIDPENPDYFDDHGTKRDYPDVTDTRIDYVFVQEPQSSHSFELEVDSIRRRHFWRGKVGALLFWAEKDDVSNYLSDHIGLEVEFTAR